MSMSISHVSATAVVGDNLDILPALNSSCLDESLIRQLL